MPKQLLDSCRLLPLNQIATLKLKQAGEKASATRLPVFQLMIWGLMNGLQTTHNRTVFELDRLQRNPVEGFDYLTGNLTGNLPGGLQTLERQLLSRSPRSAAELLLDTLDMRLKADPRNPFPG